MTILYTPDDLRCFDPWHRSYSSDKDWDACQYLADRLSDASIKKSFPIKVARGSAVDRVVMDLIRGVEPEPVEVLLRKYAMEFHCGEPSDRDIEAAVKQVALFTEAVLPTLPEVYAVQYEVHWEMDGITYHAHLDIVYADGSFDDLKAPDARLGAGRVHKDSQLTTYAAALWEAHGNLAPRVGYIGLVNGNTPEDVEPVSKLRTKPWLDRQIGHRSMEQIETWKESARRREAGRRFAASTGVYQTQAATSPWGCNGCPAMLECPAWAGFKEAMTA